MAQPVTEPAPKASPISVALWLIATLVIAVTVSVSLWQYGVGSQTTATRVLPAVPLFEAALYVVILMVLPGEGIVPARRAISGVVAAMVLRAFAAVVAAVLCHPLADGSFLASFVNFYARYWIGALVQIAVVAFFLSLVRDLLEKRATTVVRRPAAARGPEPPQQRAARQEELLSSLMDGSEAVQRRAGRGARLSVEADAAAVRPAPQPPAEPVPAAAPPPAIDRPALEMISEEPQQAPAAEDVPAPSAHATDSFPPVATAEPAASVEAPVVDVPAEVVEPAPVAPTEAAASTPQLPLMAEPEAPAVAVAEPAAEAPTEPAPAIALALPTPAGLFPLPAEAAAAVPALAELGETVGTAHSASGFSPSGRCVGLSIPEASDVGVCIAALDDFLITLASLAEALRIGPPNMALAWLNSSIAGIATSGEACGTAVMSVTGEASPGPLSLALRRPLAAFESCTGLSSRPAVRRVELTPLAPAEADWAAAKLAEIAQAGGQEVLSFAAGDGGTVLMLAAPGADCPLAAAEIAELDANARVLATCLGDTGYDRLVIGTDGGGVAISRTAVEGQDCTVALIVRGRIEPGALGMQFSRALKALAEPLAPSAAEEDAGAGPE